MDEREAEVPSEEVIDSVHADFDEDAPQDAPSDSAFVPEDYLESFAALKDSMTQGYNLKKKRKALSDYNKTLDTLKDAYRDRVHIAQNFDAIIADQTHILKATNDEIERAMAAREGIERKIADANESLTRLKQEQARERRPFEEELERRNAELASVKDELKQVKAQRDSLDLFDADPDRVSESEAAHDAVVNKVNEKFESAKAAQRSAQKALDMREKKERAQQKKSLDDIKRLNSEKDDAGKRIEELERRVTAAQERAAFCRHVMEHPEETQAMQERIASNEQTAAVMSEQIAALESTHQLSKEAAKKARAIVIVAAIVVVAFLFVFFTVTNR